TVILHVTETADRPVVTQDGKTLPQLALDIPAHLRQNYEELCRTTDDPRCHRIISQIDTFTVHSWMNALLYERLDQRAQKVISRLEQWQGDWERTYFITLARNFGFGINGDAFEAWAQHIPLPAVAHHRDDLFQIEAIFMGQAGLLDFATIPKKYRDEAIDDDYYPRLKREYDYLAHKFALDPMQAEAWKFLRLRPQNFPHVRISQLARLYYNQTAGFSQLLEAQTTEELHAMLATHVTPYWESHFTFGGPSPKRGKSLTVNSLNLIIINTVVPLLYAYGQTHAHGGYCEQALKFLEPIRAENNYITRQWADCGIKVDSATDSQALVQLKKEYCDRNYCLHCRFGYEFLKRKNNPA
ncbi:MAG: DUF2851 family protein, partial [Paraprevotella sp.]|nr:DUF2851 family protein [Paraprevotella sp.]